jgi:exopolysaccharide biosynthesis polyprenyl glycosylphosphotransferase
VRVPASRWWLDAFRRRVLAAADALAIGTVALTLGRLEGDDYHALVLLASLPLWLVLAKACGLYDRDHRALRHLTVDEMPQIVLWTLVGSALTTGTLLALGLAPVPAAAHIEIWLGLAAVAGAYRALARAAWRRLTPAEKVAVIGDGTMAAAFRRKLRLFPDMHLEVVEQRAAVDWEQVRDGRVPWLENVNRAIVASDSIDARQLAELVLYCRRHQIKLSMVPASRELFGAAVQLNHVADLPVLEFHTWDVSRTSLLAKRVIDVAIALTALVVAAPTMLAIALLVRLTSRGPVLFVQERAGLAGRSFRMLKFRTMADGADDRLSEVVDLDGLTAPAFKVRRDPRATPLGRVLRTWSLDELPQLWNVLRGEMTLVGPRPEEVELVGRYRAEDRFRLLVKPGLTGPMQVYGRGDLTFEERLAVERDYVENFSLARDLRLLALTLTAVVRRWGAY